MGGGGTVPSIAQAKFWISWASLWFYKFYGLSISDFILKWLSKPFTHLYGKINVQIMSLLFGNFCCCYFVVFLSIFRNILDYFNAVVNKNGDLPKWSPWINSGIRSRNTSGSNQQYIQRKTPCLNEKSAHLVSLSSVYTHICKLSGLQRDVFNLMF